MKHTFLFKEGFWAARGYYSDEGVNRYPVRGEVRVIHRPGAWVVDGAMLVLVRPPLEISNLYEVAPLPKGRDYTSWTSENPVLGKFRGQFAFFEDVILSACASRDGRYSGSEYMMRVTDRRYWNRGVLFEGEKKISSWATELRWLKSPRKIKNPGK